MLLRHALNASIDHCLSSGRCTVDDVVDYAQTHYPDIFQAASDQLIWKAASRQVKDLLRTALDADLDSNPQEELPLGILPGYTPPHALAVQQPDTSFVYVRYDCATWTDLIGALDEREQNVHRAELRREDHKLKMDALERVMRQFPDRTVAEACEILRKEHGDTP